jgi:hypothetical protein
MNTLLKGLMIAGIAISAASADTICSTNTPKTCVDITKNADTSIPGNFYYTCPTTINGQVYQERLSGNCRNDSTCAELKSLYVINLTNTKLVANNNACNTHN